MVRRDPQTGKFVSDSDGPGPDYETLTAITGSVNAMIQPADLSGGTTAHDPMDSTLSEIISWDRHLDADEVFAAKYLRYVVSLTGHTTQSAESYLMGAWAIQDSPGANRSGGVFKNPVNWGGTSDTSGVYDVARTDRESAGTLVSGRLTAEGSAADSASGLGLGAAPGFDAGSVPFQAIYGSGPIAEDEDSWYAPIRLWTDNVDDHGVSVDVFIETVGEKARYDDC